MFLTQLGQMHCPCSLCVPVTCAQARKLGDLVDLSDSFLSSSDPTRKFSESKVNAPVSVELQPDVENPMLSVNKEQLTAAQKSDVTLSHCFFLMKNRKCEKSVSYRLDEGVLMHHWSPGSGFTHESMCQIVVPQLFRSQVLSLAHDHCMSGHLGIKKNVQSCPALFLLAGT